jgi:glucose/arabinose dehydrogenase
VRKSSVAGGRVWVEALEVRRLLAAFDVLVFSRTVAFRHDSIDEGIAAIQQLGAANNFTVTATEDPTRFTAANLAQYEAVVFLSTTGDVLNATQQAAFEQYIAAGHGYVGIHSAADTEYDWGWYGGLVGAYFDNHPSIQQATISVADRVHPATAPLPLRWTRTDEWYNYRLNPRGDVHVLMTLDESTYTGGTMGYDHPIAWCHAYGGGRAFYTGIGHTASSYSETLVRQHLLGGIRYAAGAVQADDGVTVDSNYRKTVLDDNTLDPLQLDVAANGEVYYIQRGGAVKRWNSSGAITLGTIPVFTGAEDGLLGLALDPNFTSNRYLYLFYSAPSPAEQHVSRFTLNANRTQIDMASEKVLLRIPVQRTHSNHSGGGLGFGPGGLLYISTGDNTNPFESDGFDPIDERPGRSDWDAQKSSANTDDLRGKILRIHPEPDGTYTIPSGNLFPANGSAGRPEVHVMGVRNPFRFSVDPESGWLYWGDVGPDANDDSATRGPRGYDEINQARAAGNFGWPYFIADNRPYVDYNFATGASGSPFNPSAPVNNSPNNTGATSLPPARGSWIAYPYAASTTFPQLGSGGRAAMAGPVNHYGAAVGSPYRLPAYYDDTLFIYDWSRNWIKEVKLNATGGVHQINPFAAGLSFNHPIDLKIGPDGAMYVIEWGSGFGGGNADSQIVRVDYLNNKQLSYVTDVFVRGSTWSPSFKAYLKSKGLGDEVLGYRVTDKPAADVLPWINADQIVLQFSAVSELFPPSIVSIDGTRADYAATAVTPVAGNPLAFVLPLNRPLGTLAGLEPDGDRIRITMPGGSPTGSDFVLTLNVLQGDVNRNGTVLAEDFSDVKKRFFKTTSDTTNTDTSYSPYHDVNGSGDILANDFSEVKKRFFDDLPPATAASPVVVASAVARRDRPSVTTGLFSTIPVLG